MQQFKDIAKEFKSINADYKAEVLAAEIESNPGIQAEVYFKSVSTFRRSVSRDVEALEWEEDAQQDRLLFLVNREGIYDMIPQSLTHYTPGNANRDHEAYIELIKQQRQQEAQARKFFMPIEGEFYQQRLKLETLEREFDSRKHAARNRELFETLFGDSRIFEDIQVLTLLYLLPMASKIRGDIRLIAYCLSRVLRYEVTVEKRWEADGTQVAGDLPGMDEMQLGMSAILTGGIRLTELHYYVTVNGIEAEQYRHFMQDGRHEQVLRFLIPYFFPVQHPLHIGLNLKNAEYEWVMDDESDISFLGFNTLL